MHRRGLTRIDLLVTLVVGFIAGVLVVVLPSRSGVHRVQRTVRCLEQQRGLAEAIFAFGNDHAEQLPMVPWHEPGQFPRGDRSWARYPLDDALAYSRTWVSDQLAEVAGGRPAEMPADWLPQATHWFLPLTNYVEPTQLLEMTVCPSSRLNARRRTAVVTPDDEGVGTPMGPAMGGFTRGLGDALDFRSTYELVPVAYARTFQGMGEAHPMEQGDGLFMYRVPEEGAFRPLSDASRISLSSGKVLLFDPLERHGDGPVQPYSAANARPLVTFMDGSVRRLPVSEASESMRPDHTGNPQSFTWSGVTERAANPMGRWAEERSRYLALFRWTKGGVRGSDLGARSQDWPPDRYPSDVPFRTLRVGSDDSGD